MSHATRTLGSGVDEGRRWVKLVRPGGERQSQFLIRDVSGGVEGRRRPQSCSRREGRDNGRSSVAGSFRGLEAKRAPGPAQWQPTVRQPTGQGARLGLPGPLGAAHAVLGCRGVLGRHPGSSLQQGYRGPGPLRQQGTSAGYWRVRPRYGAATTRRCPGRGPRRVEYSGGACAKGPFEGAFLEEMGKWRN